MLSESEFHHEICEEFAEHRVDSRSPQSRYDLCFDGRGRILLCGTHVIRGYSFRQYVQIHPQILDTISSYRVWRNMIESALTDTFLTLLHWGLDPKHYRTEVCLLDDALEFGIRQIAIQVLIPYGMPWDWLELWDDIQKQVNVHIPTRNIIILVERGFDGAD